MKRIKSVLKYGLVVLIIIAIPILFSQIFHGQADTHFWFLKSSLSVSDWFAFWISYISAIVSTFLAVAAMKLSNTIEVAHQYEEAAKNKTLFKIKNAHFKAELGRNIDKCYDVDVALPFEVQCLNNLKVIEASVSFNDGYIMRLECQDDTVDGSNLKLRTCSENIRDNNERILMWKLWHQNMTPGFESICINITYCYVLNTFNRRDSARKTICETEVKCQLSIFATDPTKTETIGMLANVIDIKNKRTRR